MVPRSLAGITVSLFKPHKPDTSQIRLRESACTAQLLITSWERILLVGEIVQHLISLHNHCIVPLSLKLLIIRNSSARGYNKHLMTGHKGNKTHRLCRMP